MKRALPVYGIDGAHNGYAVKCPACGCLHHFNTTGPGPQWTFSGDEETPTFSPSMLIHYPEGYAPPALWRTINRIGTLWKYPLGSERAGNVGIEVPAELAGFCELSVEAVAAALGVEPTFDAIEARVNAWLKQKFPGYVCHSFVKDGWIEYCGDCTHEFRGQRIVLPAVIDSANRHDAGSTGA